MHTALRFGFLILLLLLTATAGAQDAAPGDWEVLLYDGSQVLVVDETGVSQTMNLPAAARSLEVVADRYVALSPNHRHFAFAKTTMSNEGFMTTLNIANLETGDCCITAGSPFTQEGTYVQVGPFSPDSARLFVAATRWLPASETYESAFLIIDAASGAVLQQSDPRLLWGTDENTTLLPRWTSEGITLYPACIPCEGTFEGQAWRWNPDTGESEALDIVYTSTGDWLAATGEYIYAAENASYAPPAGNYPVRYNVIEYRNGDSDPQVIYHQPGQFAPRPMWGLDGRAYLLHAPMTNTAVIVNRGGMVEPVELPVGITLLAGTPDGWLLWSQTDGSLYHVARWADGLIHAEIIGSTAQSAYPPQVLQRPALGGSAAGTAMRSSVR